MPDNARALQECLTALKEQSDLRQVLGRYPEDRAELVSLLRLSVDVSELSLAPAADPAFRLRARNRMLAVAAHSRRSRRWNPFASVGRLSRRPAFRLAATVAVAAALALGGLTVAASDSLPGQPLYALKTGFEQLQLAVTFDPAANARLRLHLAERRLDEAQRLIALGRVRDGITLINQYDGDIVSVDRSLTLAPIADQETSDFARLLDERRAQADARLQALAGTLRAGGDAQAAAAVVQAQTHVDRALAAGKQTLQAQQAHAAKPAQSQPAAPRGVGPSSRP